jgi:hypothetical protein
MIATLCSSSQVQDQSPPPTTAVSNNGGRDASDTDDSNDDHGALARLPGRPAAAWRSLKLRLRRRVLRRAGRGADAHRAVLRLRPGVCGARRGARRVVRLHEAIAPPPPPAPEKQLAEPPLPLPLPEP